MRRQQGFTLLELLLATVLLVVLMAGVLMVVTRVIRPGEAAVGPQAVQAGVQIDAAWAGLLRDDLSQARSVATGPDRIEMMSYGGLDPQTGERSQRPVRVRYSLRQIGGRSWLVRDELSLDTLIDTPMRRELVGTGITRFVLIAPPEIESSRQSRRGRDERAGNAAEQVLPPDEAWRLRVWTGEGRGEVTERVIVLQGGLSA